MTDLPTVPVQLRVHLAHATVQAIADEAHADILHIKGPATDATLRPTGRASVDADVLVRPAHLERFLGGLRKHGWQEVTRLRSGGLVQHATVWYHGELGQLDVHVRFPGIQVSPDQAFERLWSDRKTHDIAQRPCTVPSITAQRLILLLHAARGSRREDIRMAWVGATPDDLNGIQALARDLEADVALAAATGRLHEFKDSPEYDLWRLYSEGAAWRAVIATAIASAKAAPDGFERARWGSIAFLASRIWNKPRNMAAKLKRKPTPREVFVEYWRMGTRIVRETAKLFSRR